MPLDVRTASGVLRGVDERGVLAFRGIPYATLPVRWGAPEHPPRWEGVRDADRFGPPPPQSAQLGTDVGARRPEGWLTLNVWTPDLRAALPVMVWIPGGAYAFGHGGLPEYDGRVLASAGVVLVTLSYRVGLEGFGYVEGRPPNRGLLDQVAGLTWVRDNIAAFGGDPDRVTVFGQSAGGGSVAALLAMPRAAGLFSRAVAQSVQGTFFTPALAADVTRVCAAEVGVEPADLPTVDPWLLALAGDLVAARMTDLAGRWGPAVGRAPGSGHVAGQGDPFGLLTPRERQVLLLLGRGLRNKEIAAELGTSPMTVMHHTVSIYRRLGVRSRTEAVTAAVRTGLLTLDRPGGDPASSPR